MHSIMRWRIENLELFPKRGPAILAANHITNWDGIVAYITFPRQLYIMAKEELYRNAFLRAALMALGVFPVSRGTMDWNSLEQAKLVLQAGNVLGIFPEGTRSKGRGLLPAKLGMAYIARETGIPIYPMAIYDTSEIFTHFPRRANVTMHICEPVMPGGGNSLRQTTDAVMEAIAAVLPEDMRGAYGQVAA
jgi:1-acyl-sn-glycerol-3-phosphate acyltransferase